MTYCSVPFCKSYSRSKTVEKVSFHEFPSDATLARKWLISIGREDIEVNLNFYIARHYVCGKHFREEDYMPNLTRKRLKRYALPTIFESCLPYTLDIRRDANKKIVKVPKTKSKENISKKIYHKENGSLPLASNQETISKLDHSYESISSNDREKISITIPNLKYCILNPESLSTNMSNEDAIAKLDYSCESISSNDQEIFSITTSNLKHIFIPESISTNMPNNQNQENISTHKLDHTCESISFNDQEITSTSTTNLKHGISYPESFPTIIANDRVRHIIPTTNLNYRILNDESVASLISSYDQGQNLISKHNSKAFRSNIHSKGIQTKLSVCNLEQKLKKLDSMRKQLRKKNKRISDLKLQVTYLLNCLKVSKKNTT